jgi:hypothetical protein
MVMLEAFDARFQIWKEARHEHLVNIAVLAKDKKPDQRRFSSNLSLSLFRGEPLCSLDVSPIRWKRTRDILASLEFLNRKCDGCFSGRRWFSIMLGGQNFLQYAVPSGREGVERDCCPENRAGDLMKVSGRNVETSK